MTGNITYCVITHALHNFLATAISGIIPVLPFMYDLNIMVGLAGLVVGLLIGILVRVYQNQKVIKEDLIFIEEFGKNAYVKKSLRRKRERLAQSRFKRCKRGVRKQELDVNEKKK